MRHHILHVLLAAMALTACSDFLDIKPYGKTIPRTREEYKALLDETLNGIDMGSTGDEQLLGSYSLSATYEECADNLETNLTEYPAGNYLTTYIGAILSGRQSVYNYLYELIRTSNIILDGWNPDTWERADSDIVGTCHAIRGVAYYQLLRQFCAPAGSEDATLGVPIVTTFNMEAKPDRSTYAQTEAQAEADLRKALSYHIQDKMYRFNDDVVTGCLARLYHWTGRWQEALEAAMEVVDRHPLLDSTAYRTMQETTYGLAGNRLIMGNMISDGGTGFSGTQSMLKYRPISTRWLSLFEEGKADVRYALAVAKKRKNNKTIRANLRSAELYLIAMECHYHLGHTKDALLMLNSMRRLRCPKARAYTPAALPAIPDDEYIRTDATGAPLTPMLYAILRERRKEMFMENGDRFWELKRNGRPEFWVGVKGMKYWTRSFMYTFPLPVADTYVQPSLIQNPGYEEVE
ncbi:MAG: RagB/SusD family nutrient uptake outer membrane protein [Bacteroidaceae bacterium]